MSFLPAPVPVFVFPFWAIKNLEIIWWAVLWNWSHGGDCGLQKASPVLDCGTDIPWFNGFTVVQWYEAAMCHLPLFQCWWQMLCRTLAVPQLAGWWVLSRACFSRAMCCQIIYIPKISIMHYIRLQESTNLSLLGKMFFPFQNNTVAKLLWLI